jgi:transcriptional regulator with XRE-family HTH domain
MLSKRIKEYIDFHKISVYEFENKISVSRGSISKFLKNSSNIGSNVIENILSVYENINPSWLLTGQGPMHKPKLINVVEEPQAEYKKTIPDIAVLEEKLRSAESENRLLREMVEIMKQSNKICIKEKA